MISSPLRYPGGKAKLYPFFTELIKANNLFGAEYCEPYAGGAGLAIQLLTNGFVERIIINDIDKAIYAFWHSVLNAPDKFCSLINSTPITIDEWLRQKKIWERGNTKKCLELGFSVYFLNRTNRSGIIDGAGPIGGYSQTGEWKIDARFVKDKQIENIKSLAKYKKQIEVSNLDAMKFFNAHVQKKKSFFYLDPPYFIKGSKLYTNFYQPDDHVKIANQLKRRRDRKWVVSYDDVPQIRKAYSTFSPIKYRLNYSAGQKAVGSEVMFLSDEITLPNVQVSRVAA